MSHLDSTAIASSKMSTICNIYYIPEERKEKKNFNHFSCELPLIALIPYKNKISCINPKHPLILIMFVTYCIDKIYQKK